MGNIYKLKRGHYKYEFELLTKDANTLPEGELTRKYIKCVEENIRLNPSNYLWSHRRWKHEFDEEKYGRNVIQR